MSERSGARKRSEQDGASKRVSGAKERAIGQASGPVLQSGFLIILAYSALPIPGFSFLFPFWPLALPRFKYTAKQPRSAPSSILDQDLYMRPGNSMGASVCPYVSLIIR